MLKQINESIKPISYEPAMRFVTMEDILGDQLEHNHVVYNPMLPKERREHVLKIATEFHFKHKTLTDEDTDLLTTFDVNELPEFIKMYKKILNIA